MSSAQDAGDCAWLLEAPSPLVLMTVFISPWMRRQRREACIPLREILARLIPPASLARRVLPAVLTRLVALLLAGAAVVSVLHFVLLLDRSLGRCARGVDRSTHHRWP